MVAAVLCVFLLGAIVLKVTRGLSAPAAPDMANPGASGAGAGPGTGGAGASGPAPDISRMTPRERFDRLFNGIMQAADQGDTVQIERFLPMALGAYGQLDSIDIDARYHAAVLHLQAETRRWPWPTRYYDRADTPVRIHGERGCGQSGA